MDTNQKLEALKHRYQSVFDVLEQEGVSLSQVRMQDDKLMIQGAVDSEVAKEKVLGALGRVNPTWQDEVICDIRTEASQTEAPHTGQTVVNTSQDFTNQN